MIYSTDFDENILPTENCNYDSEDGPINEILLEIITKIKSSIEKVDKLKLLNFFFKLIKELIIKKEEEQNNGKNKIYSTQKTCKYKFRFKKSCSCKRNKKRKSQCKKHQNKSAFTTK